MITQGTLKDYEPVRYRGLVIDAWKDGRMMHVEIFYKNQKAGGAVLGDVTHKQAVAYAKKRILAGEFEYYTGKRTR